MQECALSLSGHRMPEPDIRAPQGDVTRLDAVYKEPSLRLIGYRIITPERHHPAEDIFAEIDQRDKEEKAEREEILHQPVVFFRSVPHICNCKCRLAIVK